MPGPVTYTPGHVIEPNCFWLFSYKGGTFSGGANYTCASPSLG
jgi:hypothetical protein